MSSLRRQRRPGTETAEETLIRVRSRLEAYRDIARERGGEGSVEVSHVLDLLDPSGTWRYVRNAQVTLPPQTADLGDADPMTGCRPVTFQG